MPDTGYKTFLVRYQYEGAEWSVQLPARNYDDAKARLGRLIYASIDGEVVMTLPSYSGPLVALIATLRNAIRRLATGQ